MKISGHEIRKILDGLGSHLELLEESIGSEPVESHESVLAEIIETGRKVAALQTFQTMFNIKLKVKLDGDTLTLNEAVKLLGVMRKNVIAFKLATHGTKRRGLVPEKLEKLSRDIETLRKEIHDMNSTEVEIDTVPFENMDRIVSLFS